PAAERRAVVADTDVERVAVAVVRGRHGAVARRRRGDDVARIVVLLEVRSGAVDVLRGGLVGGSVVDRHPTGAKRGDESEQRERSEGVGHGFLLLGGGTKHRPCPSATAAESTT